MVCITKILRKGGLYSYRVRIYQKNGGRFSISFKNLKDAENWLEEHQENIIEDKNPDEYRKWPYNTKNRKYD